MFKFWIVAPVALMLTGAAPDLGDAIIGRVEVQGDKAILIHGTERDELSLTFAEEFDSLSLFDGEKGFWRTGYWFADKMSIGGRTMPWHQEQQLYLRAEDPGSGKTPLGINPFQIRDGMLEITADHIPKEKSKKLWGYKYSSGLISTKDAFAQEYGYFEMRANLPAGQGFWPAFWMVPDDKRYPPELDIVEVLGHKPSTVFMTAHYVENGEHKQQNRYYEGVDTSKGFHIYSMSWSPTVIRYFVDHEEAAEIPTPKGVDMPMYIMANLAVGGQFPGPVDETTPFPAKMTIDYIRFYQFEGFDRPADGVVRPSTWTPPPKP